MSELRVALVNPPGRRVYLRDYYCSKISQADYLNAPVDLLFASATLRSAARLELFDAIAGGLSPERTLRRIKAFSPDLVFGLIGSVSYREDVDFYRRLAVRTDAPIVLSGDILQERPVQRLEALPFVSALLHDFTARGLLRFFEGRRERAALRGMTYRSGNGIVHSESSTGRDRCVDLAPPLHEMFLRLPYRYPFVRSARFATILTDFGCPFRCNFCVMPSLGWRLRTLESVLRELDELTALGVREIFFLDQTFGLAAERTGRILEALRRGRFGWVCFNRPDRMDQTRAQAWAEAGCHTMILGLESGSETILRAACKDYARADIIRGFKACREAGLRTVATVILGLPEETRETFESTLELLDRVDPDFASFNVAVPRMATPLRRRAVQLGLAADDIMEMDQSGNPVAMPSLRLSRRQIQRLRNRAVRRFYFRPRYLLGRIQALFQEGGQADWTGQLRQGMALLKSALR